MHTLKFKKIDAFASQYSTGNPAAVVYLDSSNDLSSTEMLQLAKELQGFVSEVGYVSPGVNADYLLRYFSSQREVAFCGHATIAILNDIVANSKVMQEKTMFSIETMTDRLMVENRYKNEKSIYISAPPATFSPQKFATIDVASALNCKANDIDQTLPIQVINGGLETLIVPIVGLESILSVRPDLQTLKEFCTQIGVDIIILYSSETATKESKYRTRVFAPTFGYLEDPATGSGNSALGYYLLEHGKWAGDMIKIEQNNFRDSPNFVQLFARKDDLDICQVWFGGGAVLKIEGKYNLTNTEKNGN